MCDAVTFQRMEPLEEEKALNIGMTRRIALKHGRKIGSHGLADGRIGGERFFEDLAHLHRRVFLPADFLGQMIGKRRLEPVVLEDRCMGEAGKLGFGLGQLLCLRPQGRPDRVAARNFLGGTHVSVSGSYALS